MIDQHRGTDEVGFPGRGRGIGQAVGSVHPEEILPVGKHVALQLVGALFQLGFNQLPLPFSFAAEGEQVDEAITVDVFGIPGNLDLFGAGPRQPLGGSAGHRGCACLAGIGHGDAVGG